MERVRFPIDGVTYHTAAESEAYRRSGSWIWSTLGDMLRDAAREKPDVTYVAADDGTLTFAETDALSESLAASLLEIGLKPGDRAVFQIGTVKEIVVALFGCFKASVIPVCTLPQHREIEIGQLTELSGAKAYFVQGDFSPAFDLRAFARRMMKEHESLTTLIVARGEADAGEYSLAELTGRFSRDDARARARSADPLPGDVAMLQLSGGSTGVPKIIPRMHAEYLGSSGSWNVRHNLGGDDVSLWALPLIHNAGMLLMLIPSLISRRKLVIQSKFDLAAFLRAIETHRVTYTGSIGPIAPRIIECSNIEAYDLGSLRLFFTLARAEAVEQKTGIETHQMYGITEGMLMTCCSGAAAKARHETLGWPVGIDDEACVLRIGGDQPAAPGELCFRGAHTLRAYFNAPAITAESFTSSGFFRTGDLVRTVRIDDRNHYVFEGRLKDNINRGGEKFGAEEVENIIVRHPAVNDVRVVAMPDSFLGEKACAFIIPKPGALSPSVAELGDFLQRQGLAKFKLPERVEMIAEFPVTRVGKVDKQALRRMISDTLAREQAGEPAFPPDLKSGGSAGKSGARRSPQGEDGSPKVA
jgi:non-ribosomal peptide synthetase component E (peptide arylation enzyme)